MSVLSKSVYMFAIIDALVMAVVSYLSFAVVAHSPKSLLAVMFIFVALLLIMLNAKGFYQVKKFELKDIYSYKPIIIFIETFKNIF